jgi:AraC-like DNA-binding protein
LNLGWLQWTFMVFSVIVLADVVQFVSFLLNFDIPQLSTLVFILILTAINLLYFYGFSPAHEQTGFNKQDLALSTSISSRTRLNTTLQANQVLIKSLEDHLRTSESFKNPTLTIAMLAQQLGIQKRTLSELINNHYRQNFVDFINTHRIESAKERLKNPVDSGETILEVLYEVGFNSKSSFNTAFKKKTGLTPSEFKSKFK